MNNVFCRSCAKEINETARFCTGCGAAQVLDSKASTNSSTNYVSYQDVPWFRKRWFAVICCLFFSPALLFILGTGEIYFEKHGKVIPLPKYSKIILLIVGVFSIIRIALAISE